MSPVPAGTHVLFHIYPGSAMRSIVVLVISLFLAIAGVSATQTQVGVIATPGSASLTVGPTALITAYSAELGPSYNVGSVTIEYVGSTYYLKASGTVVSTSDPFSTYTALSATGSALYVGISGGQTRHLTCIGCAWCWPGPDGCVRSEENCGLKLCNSVTTNSANGPGYIGMFY